MRTAILVPSLDRPQNLKFLVQNIHEVTPQEHAIFFMVSDSESKRILADLGEHYVIDDSRNKDRRYVTRMNELVRYASEFDCLFFGQDDVVHHPNWLANALLALDKTGKQVIVVNDLHNANGTQALITRAYLQRAVFDAPGLAFHPGYHHNYADTEQFYTAMLRDELVHAPYAVVEHLHPVFGSSNARPWDDTYARSRAHWKEDEDLWAARKALIDQAFA